MRFNDVSQAVLGETHATGHAPDDRGLRSQEVYGNSVTSSLAHDPNYCALDMGSGTTLIWGNSWDQVYKNIYLFKLTRKNNATYKQIPTPNGWGYAGTEFNGTGSMWDGGTALGTDTTKGYPCLDQPGRGQGDLITGGFPNKVNSTTGTIYWPNQALEPIYIWNNTGGIVSGWGGNTYSNDSGGRVVANRDYYPSASGAQTSPTSPFNGSSGTGWGTLANRPTTCTPGVAYFATDQGSWNTSTSNPYGVQQNGADGVLYKCTAPNTWTLYYTPYIYPHPLAGGSARHLRQQQPQRQGRQRPRQRLRRRPRLLLHQGTPTPRQRLHRRPPLLLLQLLRAYSHQWRWPNILGQRRQLWLPTWILSTVRLFRLLIQLPEHRTQRCIRRNAMRQRSRTTSQSEDKYTVTHYFAEIYFDAPGQRVFNVT